MISNNITVMATNHLNDFKKKGISLVFVIALIISVGGLFKYVNRNINWNGLHHVNKWTLPVNMDDEIIPVLLKLREHQKDYILIAYTYSGLAIKNMKDLKLNHLVNKWKYGANAIALKSKYTGHWAHIFLNKNLSIIHENRIEIIKQLNSDIRSGLVTTTTLNQLSNQNIRVLIPKKFRYVFPQNLFSEDYSNWTLVQL